MKTYRCRICGGLYTRADIAAGMIIREHYAITLVQFPADQKGGHKPVHEFRLNRPETETTARPG